MKRLSASILNLAFLCSIICSCDQIKNIISPEDDSPVVDKEDENKRIYHNIYMYEEDFFQVLYYEDVNALGEVYDNATLIKWLETFTRRFFTQQFKRSCLPDGPAVFDVSVSPRGGWVMPSDASSALWMAEIAEIKEMYL